MLCTTCGTTGTGTFCSQCGAQLSAREADPSAIYWAEDEPTIAQQQMPSQTPAATPPETTWDDWLVARQPGSALPPTPPTTPPMAVGPGLPPSSPRGGPSWPLLVGAGMAAVLVLTLGGGAAWWFSTRDTPTTAAGTSTSTATAVVTTVTSTATPPPTTTVTATSTSTSTTTAATASAADLLSDLRDESLGRLVTDGSWGVSLSAKQDGTRDDSQWTRTGSHIFRLPDILDLHETIDSTYSSTASVYLLKAEDLGSTKGPDGDKLWMSIVDPGGLSSRDDAELWCEGEFWWLSGDELDNACYPRQLSSP